MFHPNHFSTYTFLESVCYLHNYLQSLRPLLHGLSAHRCQMSSHFLARWVSRPLGLALVSWAFARVGVRRLSSLRLPDLGVFPFTLLHLPLNFIRASSLQLGYLKNIFRGVNLHDIPCVHCRFPVFPLSLVICWAAFATCPAGQSSLSSAYWPLLWRDSRVTSPRLLSSCRF